MVKKELYTQKIYTSRLDSFKNAGESLVYAGRFPTSFLDSQALDSISTTLIDPYNSIAKRRFEDTLRADSTAQRALTLLVKFILGKELDYSVAPTRYKNEADKRRLQQAFSENAIISQVTDKIDEIERESNFYEAMKAAQTQKYAFGRSALAIVFDNSKLPKDLKILSSKNLGRVYIDPKSWRLKGIDYNDNLIAKRDKKYAIPDFSAEEILYFTNMDYNVTPNTTFHGMSLLEGVVHASETKRIILEEDLKETAKGLWAGIGVVKAPGITNRASMTSLMNSIDPAKWIGVNGDVSFEVHNIAHDIDKLFMAVEALDKYIIRGIGVPLPLMGFEDVTNRATMSSVLQSFKESVLEFERSTLQNQLNPQWYDSLLTAITGKSTRELEYEICTEFEDIAFDTFGEKAEAVKVLKEMNLPIADEDYLKLLGLDHLVDNIEQVKQVLDEQKHEQFEMQKEIMSKSNGDLFGGNKFVKPEQPGISATQTREQPSE